MFFLETRVNGFGGCLGVIVIIILVIVGISLFKGESKSNEATNSETTTATEEQDSVDAVAELQELREGMDSSEVRSVIGYMDHGDIIQIYDTSYEIYYGWLSDGSRITLLISFKEGLVDYFEGILDADEVKKEFENDRGY